MPIKKGILKKISKYHKLKIKYVVCFYNFSEAFENMKLCRHVYDSIYTFIFTLPDKQMTYERNFFI